MNWLRSGFQRNAWWSRVIFAALIPVFGFLYPLCNMLAAHNGRYLIVQFPIDDWIPFNRFFVLPYYYWYIQIGIGVAWLIFSPYTGRLLHRMVISLNISNILAAVFYITMPTFMIRPDVVGQDWMSQMIRNIYSIDLPFNCFPSMHVYWATIISRFWALAGPRKLWFRIINYGGLTMIILSTVFTKQHYTPDILGGLAVAWISCFLSDRIFERIGRRIKSQVPLFKEAVSQEERQE